MDAPLLGGHASFTNMSTLSDLWSHHPSHPEWHRSASFKPSSIIHPAALRPAARDWWAKEKRQTDEQGSRRRLRTGDREREGEANYSLSRALLRSYLSASHLTLNAAFRARVVSAVTDGNTSRKSSVVAVGPLNPLTGYKDGQSIRFQKGGRREKKKLKQKNLHSIIWPTGAAKNCC